MNDIDRAASALYAIPFDEPEHEFFRTLCAAYAAGLDEHTVRDWACQWPRFNELEFRAHWKGACRPGPVGPATLYQKAISFGWTDGNTTPRPAPTRATRPAEPPRKPAPGMSAAEVWERCQPAKEHAYATRKKLSDVVLGLLRILPAGDRLTIAGQSVAGWLAVPGYAANGTLQTVQFVPPDHGKKLTLPGTQITGASFTVGQDTGPIVVCEGLATASAAFSSTGWRSVSCFGWGNVRRCVDALRQSNPDARIIIAPDRGKEPDAQTIAVEFTGAVASLPEAEPSNSDLNDIFCRDGFDVVQALLESAVEPLRPEPLLKPVSVVDVLTRPSDPPSFAWYVYCPLGEVTLFSAHGGTGKSLIALMLALAVVLGRLLFGVPTRLGKVLFVSLEDGADLVRHRIASICRAWGIDPAELAGLLTIVDGTANPELFTAENRGAGDVTSTYSELRRLAVGTTMVIIDNASDAFGGDEIKRREVRAFVRALKSIATTEHCAVVLLAHVDKTTSRARKSENDEGYSGSTAWNNSVRSRLFLSRADDGLLTLAHQKANLSKRRDPITLRWPDDGLPELLEAGSGQSGFAAQRQQGRKEDERAAALLRLIDDAARRLQFCSPTTTARNNVHATLRAEPAFKALNVGRDETSRAVAQCQRAGWLEVIERRGPDRKVREVYALTDEGRLFAGFAPSAPSAPSSDDGAQGAAEGGGAPSAPSSMGGYRGESAAHKAHPDGEQKGASNG